MKVQGGGNYKLSAIFPFFNIFLTKGGWKLESWGGGN